MGNNQTIPSNIQVLKPENWIQAGEDQQKALFSNVNPYRKRLLANIVTYELIEEYQLNFIAEEDYNNYLKQLSFRLSSLKTQNQQNSFLHDKTIQYLKYIYPIRYFVNKSKNQMCTTIHTGYLYVDKVDLRLKQINDIPFPDLLYMYKATLNGFKFLYEKVGYFDIQQQMIFITKNGEIKVWMNANLAKNYPNFQKSQSLSNKQVQGSRDGQTQNVYGSQADMIKDLIFLIQKNSDQYESQNRAQLFSQYLSRKNILERLSFQHCLQQYDEYLHQNNLHCSQNMKSIPQLFSPGEFVQKRANNYDQSHVNQITSQHLNQIKKRFQPMQTIFQDQKYRQSGGNSNYQNKNKKQIQQSLVSSLTPQKIFNQGINFNSPLLPLQSEKKNVVRPGHAPFVDLSKSRYSYQSNQNYGQNDKLRSSTHSANLRNVVQNANSMSQVNQRRNQYHPSQLPNVHYQSQPQIIRNINVPNVQFGQFGIQNNNNQKIYISSPIPSFRSVGGVNNINFQNESMQQNGFQSVNNNFGKVVINGPIQRDEYYQNQNLIPGNNLNLITGNSSNINSNNNSNFAPICNSNPVFVSNQNGIPINYQPLIFSNHPNANLNNQTHLIIQNPFPIKQNLIYNAHIETVRQKPLSVQTFNINSNSCLPQQKQYLNNNLNLQKTTSRNSKTQQTKPLSVINYQRNQDQLQSIQQFSKKQLNDNNIQKSKIKYFTTKNSYQLDQEIASDLQKFLGLKIN